jgi:DNA-binding PadR family transcriptional regulator
MSASYALLGLLGHRPSYGYDLKKRFDALFGKERPLAFGQVYATLSRLERDKKVAEEAPEQAAGPERKRYAITELGRRDLENWLTAPEMSHPNAQTVFFVKVVTAILLDRTPNAFLDRQRAAHLERMRELTRLRREGVLAQTLLADFELFHLEADLRWIELTSARIASLTREIRNAD